jgi:uncharacterized protein YdeI (BOF family)
MRHSTNRVVIFLPMPHASLPRYALVLSFFLALAACRSEAAPEPAKTTSSTMAPDPVTKPSPAPVSPASAGKLVLGAPIADGAGQKASLTEVAKAPSSFANKKLVMEGKVTAVCQHRGCWMELRDESGEAHVKMAGHAFFVPKNASGKKARVMGKLALAPAGASCGDESPGHAGGAGCKAEAEKQLGRPLAKLELEAEGVEILD